MLNCVVCFDDMPAAGATDYLCEVCQEAFNNASPLVKYYDSQPPLTFDQFMVWSEAATRIAKNAGYEDRYHAKAVAPAGFVLYMSQAADRAATV